MWASTGWTSGAADLSVPHASQYPQVMWHHARLLIGYDSDLCIDCGLMSATFHECSI